MINILCIDYDKSSDIDSINYICHEYGKDITDNKYDLIFFGQPSDINILDVTGFINLNEIHICPLNSLSVDDARIIILALLSFSCKKRAHVTFIKNNDIFPETLPDDLTKGTLPYIFYQTLNSIEVSSSCALIYETDFHLRTLKELTYLIHDTTIASKLLELIICARNIIDTEIYFLSGNDCNAIDVTKAYTQYGQFVSSNLISLHCKYKEYLAKYKYLMPNLDARHQQLGLLNQLSIDASKGRHLPQLMYWYASYFLMLATYFKKNKKYYIGISLIVRSLETALQGVCLNQGTGGFGRYGRYEINGNACKGVGDSYNYISSNYFNSVEKLQHDINDVIAIRNNSLVGHGFSFLNEVTYDYCYSKTKSLINCLAGKIFGNSNHWSAITSYSQTNLLKGLGSNLAGALISNVTTKTSCSNP